MASEKLRFDLVSPERRLASMDADMVTVPALDGEIGVMPEHSPMLVQLRPGTIRVYQGSEVNERYFVAGGFVEINPRGLTVLADEEAMTVTEIDVEEARSEVDQWTKRFSGAEETEIEHYQHQLEIARARLEAAEGQL